eukprot:g2887.t1
MRVSDPGSRGKVNGEVRTYTYEELAKATGDFNAGDRLGSGGFGEVYKGVLDGKVVAIKRQKLNPEDVTGSTERDKNHRRNESAAKQYANEQRLLGKIRHPNILTLLGYSKPQDNNATWCLVYEYMEGHSLEVRLGPETWRGQKLLSVANRFTVAADIAHALHFLNTLSPVPIQHRDVKPDNILLREHPGDGLFGKSTLLAKLADFGTARRPRPRGSLGSDKSPLTHDVTENVIGTPGYRSEEFMKGEVSFKTDTYAFGVVLLNLLTARKAVRPTERIASFPRQQFEQIDGQPPTADAAAAGE